MKVFEISFVKNGLRYETVWKAESEVVAINEIYAMFTSAPDPESRCPQNAVISIVETEA